MASMTAAGVLATTMETNNGSADVAAPCAPEPIWRRYGQTVEAMNKLPDSRREKPVAVRPPHTRHRAGVQLAVERAQPPPQLYPRPAKTNPRHRQIARFGRAGSKNAITPCKTACFRRNRPSESWHAGEELNPQPTDP